MIKLDAANFWVVNWYYLAGITISFTGLVLAFKNYKKKNISSEKQSLIPIQNTNSISSPVTINNNFQPPIDEDKRNMQKEERDERRKALIKILFVDDNYSDYKMVSILKKAGWSNTKGIKDITDLDNTIVIESDIIFVDINGVGKTMFGDQGLGLATALKNKYPKKKIIIYSAETTGDRFHKALRQVDDCLSKNAEPYQFIDLIENLSKTVE